MFLKRICEAKLSSINVTLVPLQAGSLASFLKDLLLTSLPYAELVEQDFRRCIEVGGSFSNGVTTVSH